MKFRSKSGKLNAFTLIEVMVVLVIIGILVLMVLPNNDDLIEDARELEAKRALSSLSARQKKFQWENQRYATSLEELNYEEIEGAFYKIEVAEATGHAFKIIARAVNDLDGDGTFNTWEVTESKKIIRISRD